MTRVYVSANLILKNDSASSMTRHLQDPKNPLVYQKGIKLLTLDSGRQLKEKFSVRKLKLASY